MDLPRRFSNLSEYAFPRLRRLLGQIEPGGMVVDMTIGEPKHPFPTWVSDIIAENSLEFGRYPINEGTPELLQAISGWLSRRYDTEIGSERLMVLNGTREGLFNAVIALCPETKAGKQPAVLTPNPFYQVYAVAALAVGAEPIYVPATASTGFLPDYAALPTEVLDRTAIVFICSPSNPQGAVASEAYWTDLLDLAEKHDFKVFADECYSEIYRDTPPPGILSVAKKIGANPERVFAFHSLSKRSNLPGLRSGFVAGGEKGIGAMRQLRSYAGAPLPMPLQRVAERAWSDDDHVLENRALYAQKYAIADEIFAGSQAYTAPEAGFFLWLPVEDGEAAAKKLWHETGVKVLPGGYLGHDKNGGNPGQGYIRVALVAPKDDTQHGLTKLRDCLMR